MASILDTKKKRGRGRPKTGIGEHIGLRLYEHQEKKLDRWIKEQPDRPTRPEAIRRMIDLVTASDDLPQTQKIRRQPEGQRR